MAVIFAAASAGKEVGSAIGRRFGPRLLHRSGARFLSGSHAARVERCFDTHGPNAVMLARFLPVARTLAPALAGIVGMVRWRFSIYSVAGAAACTSVLLALGYFLGGVPLLSRHVDLLAVGLVALCLGTIGAVLRWHRFRRSEPVRRHCHGELVLGAVALGEPRFS